MDALLLIWPWSVVHLPRPERKVRKNLAKRQNDPKRQKYKALVGGDALSLRRSRSAETTSRD